MILALGARGPWFNSQTCPSLIITPSYKGSNNGSSKQVTLFQSCLFNWNLALSFIGKILLYNFSQWNEWEEIRHSLRQLFVHLQYMLIIILAETRDWTRDLQIFSLMLSQLSYLGSLSHVTQCANNHIIYFVEWDFNKTLLWAEEPDIPLCVYLHH